MKAQCHKLFFFFFFFKKKSFPISIDCNFYRYTELLIGIDQEEASKIVQVYQDMVFLQMKKKKNHIYFFPTWIENSLWELSENVDFPINLVWTEANIFQSISDPLDFTTPVDFKTIVGPWLSHL